MAFGSTVLPEFPHNCEQTVRRVLKYLLTFTREYKIPSGAGARVFWII
jgi:hypothetical protein